MALAKKKAGKIEEVRVRACVRGEVCPSRRRQPRPAAQAASRPRRQHGLSGFSRITSHETRNTAFLLFSLHSCKLWRGMGRLWRGMGGAAVPRTGNTACWFSRIMQHRIYRRSVHRGRERVAQPKTAVRTAVGAARSRLPCSRLFAIVRYFFMEGVLNKCPRTVRRSRSASRRVPFSAAPAALPRLRKHGNVFCCVDSSPAFLTTWRGEVHERAVRTRRKPGGGRRRAQAYLNSTLSPASQRCEGKRSPGGRIVCFDRRVVRNAG